MKKYKFRLEAVLKYREIIEKLREQDFATANGMLTNVERQIAKLGQERRDVMLGRPGSAAGSFDATSIYDRERYIKTIDAALEEQNRFAEAARIVVAECLRHLVAAKQASQSVAKLREKDKAEYITLALQLEQNALDEMATLRKRPGMGKEE